MLDQKNELESVKRKIRSLSEVKIERGFSEAEVYKAMVSIGKLLDTFNLSMSDVLLQQEPCITEYFDTGSKHRNVAFLSCSGIASFCQVKYWQNRWSGKGIVIAYYGLESDVKMAMYLSEMIMKASETATIDFKQSDVYQFAAANRRKLTFSFYNGMSARLRSRFGEMLKARLEQEASAAAHHQKQMKDRMIEASDEAKVAAANATTGTALILMSVKKATFIEEEFKKINMKLRSQPNKSKAYASGAHQAGVQAADKLNLSRPLANAGYGENLLLK